MKRAIVVATALVILVAPAALAAPPADKGKPESPGKSAAAPGQSADQNAAKKCKAMRKSNASAFASAYGTKPNAFGKCVSSQVKKAEGAEALEEAKENAAKKCKKLRQDMGIEKFRQEYGTNANGANAFGKCVSEYAKKTTT